MSSESLSLKPNIIFIDDEYHVLKTIQRLTKKLPANCFYFNDSESALTWLTKNRVDIAVSDFNMPNHSGIELLKSIAERYPESLRILITGYAHADVLREAINDVKLWGLIEKPWDNSQFKQVINDALVYHERVRRRLNQQLTLLEKEAIKGQDSEQLEREFLAMMSHEIRTPMTNVIGALSLLQETTLSAKQQELTDHAIEAGNSMLELLSDLITYSKLASGFQSLSVKRVNFLQALKPFLDQYRVRAEEKKLTFDVIVADGCDCELYTDIKVLRQILSNLIDNAIKFTHSGSVNLNIERDTDSSFRFTIQDTGVGIPVNINADIFGKFIQMNHSYNREYEGTGLGLAISKLLTEKLGGQIDYTSQEGNGSQFWFTILDHNRAFDDSVTENQQENVQFKSPVEAYEPNDFELAELIDKEILLVEDSPANQLIIKSMLQSTRVKVTIANDGQEAIDIVQSQHFDLILMDLSMPRIDGAEAARYIRDKLHLTNIPIIALTANVELYDIKYCLSSGMTDYVFKPVDKSYLIRCIAYYLNNRSNDKKSAPLIPAQATDQQYINQVALEQLLQDTSPATVQKIADMYFQEMRKRAATIIAADGDIIAIGKEAHAIKSSSATIGAAKTSELAKKIDSICKSEEQQGIQELVAMLLSSIENTEAVFAKHIKLL